MNLNIFPPLNACLNGLSAILLLCGFIAIKKSYKEVHKKFMISAFIVSSLFLVCYLYYHYHFGSKYFPDLGWIKTAYLMLLLTHTILAVVMLPFILLTFFHAHKQNWIKYKTFARLDLPMWLYVSVPGVVMYFRV